MESKRVSFGELLGDLSTDPLDPGCKPIFVFALVKYSTPEGDSWGFRTSSPPNREELLGALSIQVELVKQGLLDDWDVDDEDDPAEGANS